MLKRTQKKKNYKNRNEICEKIFLVLKRHRCIHSFQPKIPCLRQHKQAVTLHLDDRALGFPFLLEPSERGSCRKHHLLERKRDREGDRRRRDMALGRVRHSRAAPGLCTPVSPPSPQPCPGILLTGLGTHPAPARHPPDTAAHPKVSSPLANAGMPAGGRWGSPPPPALPLPSPAGHPARQLGHCSRVPAPWPAQWRSPRLPLRPIASTMAGPRSAGMARHGGPLADSPHLPRHGRHHQGPLGISQGEEG